jgi:NhaP-type Na+/H+ or K+/H+ antiporter
VTGQKQVPERLRYLLNVESGLNDGLALPLVIGLLDYLQPETYWAATTLTDIALGIGLGVTVPWFIIQLERSRFFGADPLYQPLTVLTIGLLLFALASLAHANEFLAAFVAGVTVATLSPRLRDKFQQFGKLLAELFKLAALLVFGALISPHFLYEIGWEGYVFALLVLVVPRPLALCLSLPGAALTWREWVTAAWFGPKGFASVFLTLLVLRSGIPAANQLYHLAALVIAASIILHSSTDVLLARWFEQSGDAAEHHEPEPVGSS